VARLAVGNPYLAFCIAAAFAAPLVRIVGQDGGGFNLYGDSSKGKTTCLWAAASVWGKTDRLHTWHGTGNGLEGIAASHNDSLLVLDEMSQADAKTIGATVYMLANGASKLRLAPDAALKRQKTWRLLFLSTGEQDLANVLKQGGGKDAGAAPRAGQDVRIVDIPCPAGGLFQNPHGMADMGEFAARLKREAKANAGHAIRLFLDRLIAARDRAQLEALQGSWIAANVTDDSDSQVVRVAERFALVAAAGEMAAALDVLPWPRGTAAAAAREAYNAWIGRRGHTGGAEAYRGIANLLDFLSRHGEARFDDWHLDTRQTTRDRAGTRWKNDTGEYDYYIHSDGFREACGGIDPRRVALGAVECGLLTLDARGKAAHSVRVPGHGQGRYYVVTAAARNAYAELQD
jgi:putative DNA primase/helicase